MAVPGIHDLRHRFVFLFIAVVCASGISCTPAPRDAAIDAILDLYDQYDIVHIADRHWNLTDYGFRVALIGDPRFAEVVDDIVIESGNWRYQEILDDYILELKSVPDSALRKVWRNTVVPTGVWDATIYKDFIRTVRSVNERLARSERIRVIAAEPPIDWDEVETFDDWMEYFSQRSTHTPQVVKSEVIDKNHKALIVYGGAHFFKTIGPFEPCRRNIRSNLEELIDKPIFSIMPVSGNEPFVDELNAVFSERESPVFVNLKTSELADVGWELMLEGTPSKLGDFADGVIYFGPDIDPEAEYDPEAARDSVYQVELRRRQALQATMR